MWRWLLWCRDDGGNYAYLGDWHLDDKGKDSVHLACLMAGFEVYQQLYWSEA